MRGCGSFPLGCRVLVVAVVLGAASVGCGGGGGTDSDLTLAAWQEQADLICMSVRQEAAADQPVTGAGNPAVPIRARAVLVDNEADRLSDLGRPDKQADTVEDLLAAKSRQVAALNDLADDLLADPTATAGTAWAALNVEIDKVDEAAAELGVLACSTQTGADGGSEPPTSGDPSEGGGFGDQGQTTDG